MNNDPHNPSILGLIYYCCDYCCYDFMGDFDAKRLGD